MSIYNIYGNQIDLNDTLQNDKSDKFDYWSSALNLNGEYGYIANSSLDSSGNLKSTAGFALTGFIPLEALMKIKISDISKINITASRIYWFKEDKTYYTKKSLSEIIDGKNYLDGERNNDGVYAILGLSLTDYDISITCEYPEIKNRIDNDWFNSFWNNTSYNKVDFAVSDIPHYGTIVGNDSHFNTDKVRQPRPAYFSIPYIKNFNSYKILISKYPDMTNARTYIFDIYREYYGITNLEINQVYWVKIFGIENEVENEIDFYSYKTEGLVRQLSYIANMRDIGGHKTEKWGEIKQGRIYRCAKLDGYSEQILNKLKNDLNIHCEIDLRLESEIAEDYVSPFDIYYNKSIGSFQSVAQNIQTGIENYAVIFKYIVARLKEGKNLLYHCKGGADRTGVISAILEGVLGASANTISLDYESTANHTSGTARTDLEDDNHWFSEGMLAIEEREGNTYSDKWINLLLQGGVTEDEIEDFRCIMLTDY